MEEKDIKKRARAILRGYEVITLSPFPTALFVGIYTVTSTAITYHSFFFTLTYPIKK